jgi:hypothetical protein
MRRAPCPVLTIKLLFPPAEADKTSADRAATAAP